MAWLILIAGFIAGIAMACALGRPAQSKWRSIFLMAIVVGTVLGFVHTFLDFRGIETVVLVPLSIAGALKVTFGFIPGIAIGGLYRLVRYAFDEDVDGMRRIRAVCLFGLIVSLAFSLGVILGWPYSTLEKMTMFFAVIVLAVGTLVTHHFVEHENIR